MHIPHKATLSIKTTNKTAFNILSKETKVCIVNKTKKAKIQNINVSGKTIQSCGQSENITDFSRPD